MIDTVLRTVAGLYDSLILTFGSPVVLLAISATLIALAVIELFVRKHAKCCREVR
ncbi:MAG TPA: hypothetical protein VGJ92_11295 [Methanocella sp.]|jgi:hypothetical protein